MKYDIAKSPERPYWVVFYNEKKNGRTRPWFYIGESRGGSRSLRRFTQVFGSAWGFETRDEAEYEAFECAEANPAVKMMVLEVTFDVVYSATSPKKKGKS